MKKTFTNFLRCALFAFCCIYFQFTKAQFVPIPDPAFATFLQAKYPGCMSVSSMDTNCVDTIKTLNLSSLNIHDLTGIQYFGNLDTLDCSQNQLTTLPSLPATLKYLLTSQNKLTGLPALPPGLFKLDCGKNPLTALPALPATLQQLYCGEDSLTSLPALPDTLRNLFCFNNQLTKLPALPAGMIEIYCYFNQLTSLPALPDSLFNLDCSNNPHLTSIPTLPTAKFLYLNCSGDSLVTLPPLPATMTVLYCFSNFITTLPALPSGLVDLNCSVNPLTSLPALPRGMTSLNCSFIGLPALPVLPDSLEGLNCSFNALTYLPGLPHKLIFLDCSFNNLAYLPEFPELLQSISCGNNPLQCLPRLRQLNTLDFANTAIECVPSYNQLITSNPPLGSFPLCNLFNSNGCDYYLNVSGDAYFDNDNNCVLNPIDTLQKNVKLFLSTSNGVQQQIFTNTNGIYSFRVNTQETYSVTVDTSELPLAVTCPNDNLYQNVVTVTDSSFLYNDFAVRCKDGFDVGAWSIVAGTLTPGENTKVDISAGDLANFTGISCVKGIGGTVVISLNGPVTYISPVPGARVPTGVIGNTVIWNVVDFDSVNFNNDFNFIIRPDANAPADKQVCITLKVTPATPDNKPGNDTLTQCFLTGPKTNYEEAFPVGQTDTSEKWVTYTIHFQNTGTDSVKNVRIVDTLDTNFDITSFQLLAYRHKNTTVVGEYRIVQFNFPSIGLPDSSHDAAGSKGYIQYRVKLNENLPLGTQIANTAHIYFDQQAPVNVNTTKNTITTIISTEVPSPLSYGEGAWAEIFPNPVADRFYIVAHGSQPDWVTLFDISGEKINEQKYAPVINISSLPSGVYFVEIKSGMALTRKKVVKL